VKTGNIPGWKKLADRCAISNSVIKKIPAYPASISLHLTPIVAKPCGGKFGASSLLTESNTLKINAESPRLGIAAGNPSRSAKTYNKISQKLKKKVIPV
jgi:hypothetical protein